MSIIIIQKQLLADLKEAVENHNEGLRRKKIKLDYAVYIVSLLNTIASNYRKEDRREDIPLSTELLKKVIRNYKWYFEFLTKEEHPFLIKVKNYGVDIGRCTTFKLNDKYRRDEIVSYDMTEKILMKKFDEKGRDKHTLNEMKVCNKHRPHLLRFFDDNLTINPKEAYEDVKPLFINDDTYESGKNALVMINEFHSQQWKYSMNEETDNRLHSNLTRSPRILRKHIKYDGKTLVGLDLKTCQPFFLCVLIAAIVNRDREILRSIGATHLLHDYLIESLFNLNLDINNLRAFVKAVLKGDFYNSLIDGFPFKYDKKGNIYRDIYNKNKVKDRCVGKPCNMRKTVYYDSERDCVKAAVMEFLYSKPTTKVTEVTFIKNKYPSISKIVKEITSKGIDLHRILQYVEANVLLDNVALVIHEKYPDMPLFSIHDCLVTTEEWKDTLKEEMIKQVKLITSMKPIISEEYW